MYFSTLGCVVAPYRGVVGGNLHDAVLMGDKNVAVSQKYGVADFAAAPFCFMAPRHRAILDDVDQRPFSLAGIHKIMMAEIRSNRSC